MVVLFYISFPHLVLSLCMSDLFFLFFFSIGKKYIYIELINLKFYFSFYFMFKEFGSFFSQINHKINSFLFN